MIIDCVSDLHGHYPELEGGDLLIIAGDLTARDYGDEYGMFFDYLEAQDYKKIIVIAGNHDNYLESHNLFKGLKHNIEYLCDSGTEFEGLKIWGSPWTQRFKGMNPQCMAFTVHYDTHHEEMEPTKWGTRMVSYPSLEEKWKLIPNKVDILVTHCPPYGIMDRVDFSEGDSGIFHTGSKSLLESLNRIRPKLHVFGHIHEEYGSERPSLEFVECPGYPIFVNASHVNEKYEPVNKPIRIEL